MPVHSAPRGGAVWQLVGLITRRSQVQILSPQPTKKPAKRTPAGFLLLVIVTLRPRWIAGLFSGPCGHAVGKNASAFQALCLSCPSGSSAELSPAGEDHRMHEAVATYGAPGGRAFLYCHCSSLIDADAHYGVLLGNSLRGRAAQTASARVPLWRNHGRCPLERGDHMVVEAMTRHTSSDRVRP